MDFAPCGGIRPGSNGHGRAAKLSLGPRPELGLEAGDQCLEPWMRAQRVDVLVARHPLRKRSKACFRLSRAWRSPLSDHRRAAGLSRE